MPIVLGDASEDVSLTGAVVDLLVGVNPERTAMLTRNNFAVPERARVRAQIDTGSSFSVISADVLRGLDIKPFDQTVVRTVTVEDTTQVFDRYVVSLYLPGEELEMLIERVPVMASFFAANDDVQALIGRDILEHCLFVYDGLRRVFSLAF